MALARSQSALNSILAVALLLTGFAALMLGTAQMSPLAALNGLFGDSATDRYALIVQEIRLPRVLLGMMVGASLGLAGAALQGLLRNPLADPGVIGVSASAGLGAVIAIYYGFAAAFSYAVPGFAIIAALAATFLLHALASRDASVLSLILLGVAISSLAGALTALVMNLAPTPFTLSDMVLWLLGSLSNRSYTDIYLAAPFMLAGWVCLMLTGRGLTGLSLGEDAGATLGVNLKRQRSLIVFGTALSVGAAVAVSGAVGFIGLMVPHMIRPFVGYDPGRLLLPSALGGALLLTLADIIVRTAPTSQELRLGVVTALIGAPFFIYLVIRTRREMR